ncbi:Peroxisomal membrane protein PEX30 [Neolecta irregularis DAH-3]|uniref:Peroxisomal membrane protein PEX30 n=1 Tax=Neolecta irregularis (strain DAH-3) TaxID=1198029 RepID=A0A1U7LUC1_NEOID|nr:Peroxisomal membrane protein PEX30 [Neolecta irregularis DAH-3]|eukprot:OLL26275.1 Peroxisomal membrane protein PEX30 [Neolecta irregularis DAH-3]
MAFEDCATADSMPPPGISPVRAEFVAPHDNVEAVAANDLAVLVQQLGPAISAANGVARVLAWRTDTGWPGVLLVLCWWMVVLYLDRLLILAAPLVPAVVIVCFYFARPGGVGGAPAAEHALANARLQLQQLHVSLAELERLYAAAAALLDWSDPERTRGLLLRFLVVAPAWPLLLRAVSLRVVLLLGGSLLLTWPSAASRVIRVLLARSRLLRLLASLLFAVPFNTPPSTTIHLGKLSHHEDNTVQHIVWENQRKWIGLGWTANFFPGERSAWTDEDLLPAQEIDTYKISSEYHWLTGWKIVQQWAYTDNKWLNPSNHDGFTRFTRRRKWERYAERVDGMLADGIEEAIGGSLAPCTPEKQKRDFPISEPFRRRI